MNTENDGLAGLADALAIKRSGFHRVVGPGGHVAVFPMQAANEEAWQARALQQTKDSEALEARTRPEPRPASDGIRRVTRGD